MADLTAEQWKEVRRVQDHGTRAENWFAPVSWETFKALVEVAESAKAEAQAAGTEAATILRELWAVSQLDEPDFGRMAAVGVAHAKWIEKHGAQSPAPEPHE